MGAYADGATEAGADDASSLDAGSATGFDGNITALAMYGCPLLLPRGSDAECPPLRSSDAASDATDSGDSGDAPSE